MARGGKPYSRHSSRYSSTIVQNNDLLEWLVIWLIIGIVGLAVFFKLPPGQFLLDTFTMVTDQIKGAL